MNPASQIRPELAAFGIRTAYLTDTTGSVSRAYGVLGKGMHAGLPGHGFVLIDTHGIQRWYGEYPSIPVHGQADPAGQNSPQQVTRGAKVRSGKWSGTVTGLSRCFRSSFILQAQPENLDRLSLRVWRGRCAVTYFDFEDHRVFYTREGAGDPIVFLPNATLTGKLWEHQAGHFKASNDVIVVDLPGFGRSDFLRPTLALYLRWLERFIDELHLAPVALVGNCIGSLTALHYATTHPDAVSALVLMNMLDRDVGTAPPLNRGISLLKVPRLRPLVELGFRHLPQQAQQRHPYPNGQFGDITEPSQHEYVAHAHQCFADPHTRVAWLSLAYDVGNDVLAPASQLAGVPPICWIWGKANQLLPYEIGKHQLDVLHPEEVHVLPGRGYAAAWDDPGEVNAIIGAFLERHPRSAQRATAPAGTVAGHLQEDQNQN